jgi:hypothetical protein
MLEKLVAALTEGTGDKQKSLATMSEEMSEENLPLFPEVKAVNQGWGDQKRILAGCLTKTLSQLSRLIVV